ncbi:MAG: TonB-dependent receptor [Candidatus Solibacter usitatus]|nr:TonB-dependent receptor [Candidatus Solibacter usitatus]
MSKTRYWALCLCMLGCALSARLMAQAVTGTILGTIKDSTGAVVSGAAVMIASETAGVTRSVKTDDSGEYTAPSLPTGAYGVSVEKPGFKKTTAAHVQLGVDQKVRVDVVLQVGQVSETVNVEAAALPVQSDTSELAQTVTERQIADLPLNGRDFVQLTRIIPGVQRGIPGANIDGAGSLAWRASASFAANGQRTRDNNFLLDGVDNNETWLNSVVVFPSVDALEEFKVQTSTYSAEFGRSSGGVVNIQIKSGTNAMHGSGFEFLRNDKLDANDLFNNKNARPKPPFRQNQFGGTLGGPVRRDKTFFFMDYQGWRVRDARTYLSNVPSTLMRGGDFSELNRTIYDPLSSTPFAGNRIPTARFDPASKNILEQLYPLPNVPGQRAANGQTISNYLRNPVLTRQDDQFDVKVDQNFGSNNHAFGRYSLERTERFLPATLEHGDAGVTFGAGTGLVRAQGLALNDTHTFSPRLLNEFRFGFSRFAIKLTSIDAGTNQAEKVGIPGINIRDSATAMSQITFTPGDIQNLGANGNQPLLTFLDTFQYFDNVTYVRGRHTIKTGFNFTRRRRNVFNADSILGTFNFQAPLTSNCAGIASGCTINPTTGFSAATFLLGYPTSIQRGLIDGVVGERRPEYGAYVQDDIRVSSRLTLNVGLRYDLFVPYVEVHDRQSNLDPATGKFILASPDAKLSDGRTIGRELQFTPKKDFAPRIGFAWDASGNGHTIVRGGYGIFWNNPMTGTSSQKSSNPPFLLSQSLTTSLLPALRLSAGLPPPPAVDPNRAPAGATRSIFDPNFKDGYAQQWNLNVQRAITSNYLLEVAYAGARGTHLVLKQDINQAPPVLGVTSQDVNRPYIRLSPLLRGLSQVQSRGYSSYHALQTKLTKRFSRGLMFIHSYTFGKTIDIVSDTEGATLNAYNFNQDKGLAQFDIRHNLTSSVNYELPFGKGQAIGGSAGAVANKLIGGWQVNSILLVRSGLPFTVTQQQGLLSTGTGNRPNRIGTGKLDNPKTDRWFDLAAFAPTTDNTGAYGNSGRDILSQPRQFNLDFSVIKNTRFRERFEHQFRVELFNSLNHPQFAGPGSSIGTGSAGVISSLLFNTPMRQIQMAMKLRF